ncbi:MAG TPA: MoaD/ThiS family protein [Bacteroidota bacterium]|nr:MoaD/ThiS family protein [Bacteroidota bacterium]
MRIKLKLFSIARDLAGFGEEVVELPPNSTADAVMNILAERNAEFRKWKTSLRFAVNYEYVSHSHQLRDGDEVAVIPPVSGG